MRNFIYLIFVVLAFNSCIGNSIEKNGGARIFLSIDKENTEQQLKETQKLLEKMFDVLNIKDASIKINETSSGFEVLLPEVDSLLYIRQLLTKGEGLSFYRAARVKEILPSLLAIDSLLSIDTILQQKYTEMLEPTYDYFTGKKKKILDMIGFSQYRTELLESSDTGHSQEQDTAELRAVLENSDLEIVDFRTELLERNYLGYYNEQDTAVIKALLKDSIINYYLPKNMKFAFMKGKDFNTQETIFLLMALQQPVAMKVTSIVDLKIEKGDYEDKYLDIVFTDADGKLFEKITEKYLKEFLAIVIDGEIIISPIILSPIVDGAVSITGLREEGVAESLYASLIISSLPVEFSIESIDIVAPVKK